MIFLHGLGDTPDDVLPLFIRYNLTPNNFRIILPTSPELPSPFKKGKKIKSWYSVMRASREHVNSVIKSHKDIVNNVNQVELRKSASIVLNLIEQEKKQVPLQRIFIGGFSQGGSVSTAAMLTSKFGKPLAGVISLSSPQMCDHGELKEPALTAIRETPMFVYIGESDTWMKIELFEMSF